jgi:hypothetical protein
MIERRRERRQKVLKQGKVVLTESVSIDCVVRDLSPSGARIEFEAPLYLPSEFRLHIVSADLTIPAAPAWQKQREAGIRFVGVGTVGSVDNSPKRIVSTAA